MVQIGRVVRMSGKADKTRLREARKARLAKSLRDNLGRRKDQARGRDDGGGRAPAPGPAAPSNGHKDER